MTKTENPLLEIDSLKASYLFYVNREIAGLTPSQTAEGLEMTEEEYLEYEQGKRKVTIELVQKAATLFKIDPLSLVSSTNTNHFKNVFSSPINSNFHTYKSTNEKQNDAILKLIDNVTEMNSRVMELLERK